LERELLFKHKPFLVIGSCILLSYLVILIIGPRVAPYQEDDQDLFHVLEPPSWSHVLGTDSLGRDILSRIIYGTRYSFLIAITSVFISASAGILIGLTSGFFGGNTDTIIMRFNDILLTTPEFIATIIVVSVLHPGVQSLIIAISVSFTPRIARLTRSAVLPVKERDFIYASRAIGASNLRLMLFHVLPNAAAPILVEVTLRAGQAVLLSAALGFLGLGVQPPKPEWGAMISRGRQYMAVAPHIAMGTGLAISMLVLGFNLLGDGLRDWLDPKLKGV
jgi:ABC-type dipeptide/oligopeptide/nickel transport system permease subunit